MRTCCACKYKHKTADENKISFHKFPNDEYTRKLWIAAIGIKNFSPTKQTALCSQHFTDDCLFYPLGGLQQRRRLKRGAVPSIFGFRKLRLNTCEIKTEYALDQIKLEPDNEYSNAEESPSSCQETESTKREAHEITGALDITETFICEPDAAATLSADSRAAHKCGKHRFQINRYTHSDTFPEKPKRKWTRHHNPRFVGDCDMSDFATPQKAVRNWNIALSYIRKQRNKITSLQRKNRSLQNTISDLRQLVSDLTNDKNSLTSTVAVQMIKSICVESSSINLEHISRAYENVYHFMDMVSIVTLFPNLEEFQTEMDGQGVIALSSETQRWIAAQKIQAWFRGIATRKHLNMLDSSARTIQKHWREYRTSKCSNEILQHQVREMWCRYYHRAATKIQSLWRGYEIRKITTNLMKEQNWLSIIYSKNAETPTRMEESRTNEILHMQDEMERESMLWVLFILFKLHHLLGTACRPGILTWIDKSKSMSIEKMLKCLKYKEYMKKQHRNQCKKQPRASSPARLANTRLARCEKEIQDFQRSVKRGKIYLRRNCVYAEGDKLSKVSERLRSGLVCGKFDSEKRFVTSTKIYRDDRAVRVIIGDYTPKESGFPPIRPLRDISKELDGDFKLICKPDGLYRPIDDMDCSFKPVQLKCPLHNDGF